MFLISAWQKSVTWKWFVLAVYQFWTGISAGPALKYFTWFIGAGGLTNNKHSQIKKKGELLSERNVALNAKYLRSVWKEPCRGFWFVTFVTFRRASARRPCYLRLREGRANSQLLFFCAQLDAGRLGLWLGCGQPAGYSPSRRAPRRPCQCIQAGARPNGHKPKRSQTQLVTNPNGHNPKWSQTQMVPNPTGPKPNWSKNLLVPNPKCPQPKVSKTQSVQNPTCPKLNLSQTHSVQNPKNPKPNWSQTQSVQNPKNPKPNWFQVCVLLCFVDPILGNLTVRGHSLSQGTWGCRILSHILGFAKKTEKKFEQCDKNLGLSQNSKM